MVGYPLNKIPLRSSYPCQIPDRMTRLTSHEHNITWNLIPSAHSSPAKFETNELLIFQSLITTYQLIFQTVITTDLLIYH